MKPEEIKLSDWHRIFAGPVPAEFYIELIIRGIMVYLILVVTMRLMGRRVIPGTSRLQLSAIVALGSAIGVPLLTPANGMLPAFIITAIIILITRSISWLSLRNRKMELSILGNKSALVENGVMNLKAMQAARITRERLFAQLRFEHQVQMGKVKRMYMEASGTFTMIESEETNPGLLLIPDWDTEFVNDQVEKTDQQVCLRCGNEKPADNTRQEKVKCPNCGASQWTQAVIEKEKEQA
jgi:uncharacterized membrane protein YcaP (DUF421 family)